MKITAIILFTACMAASAGGFAQITLTEKNTPLPKVLKKIEQQSGYEFLYPKDLVQKAGTITVEIKNANIQDALIAVLNGKGLDFTISDKSIIIKQSDRIDIKNELTPLPIDIKGRIINEEGKGVAANIIVKGTQNGTASNSDGYFELKNVDESATLIITGITIERLEIKVNNRTNIAISAKTKVAEGEDVIVKTNYWETKKKLNPGNISKVTAEEIQQQPVQNPIAALMGRVPGLEIVQQTGMPGGNFQIRIRGLNSIANGNDPLFVIDGVPFTGSTMSFNETSFDLFGNSTLSGGGTSPLSGINPADIESIEILKDADATAIYGSRGANGVILITTKKGKAGKTKVDLNLYTAAGKVGHTMNLLSNSQYIEMRREALQNAGFWPLPPSLYQYIPDIFVWDTTQHNDWQKMLIGGTAGTTDAQLSVSGGDQYTQFSVGMGYRKENTVFPGNNSDQRLSARVSLDNKSQNEKFRTSLSLKYSVNNTDLIARDLTRLAISLPPVAPPLYKDNGDLNWGSAASNAWDATILHPLRYLKTGYDATAKNLLANGIISYAILPNLEVKSNLGYSDVVNDAITTNPLSSLEPTYAAISENSSDFSNSSFRNWTVEPQVNWKPKLGKGRFDILAGLTFLEQVQEGLAQHASGFATEALMKNLGAAASRGTSTNYYSQYRYNAIFGRINYTLKGKYIINLTGRRDGSSRFGSGKQFANFGAIGTAWIFSDEYFIKNTIPFLSLGKIRASYGIAGNDQLTNYQYLDTYTPSGVYGDILGLTPVRLANPDFAWETNRKLEVGLEMGFINNRILSSVSYYRNRSSNQLVGLSLPPTTGFNTIQSNFPAVVQNSGVELELSTRNIERTNFTWSTSFNLSVPCNKLVKFPGIEASPTYANKLIVGQPLSILMSYHYLGVDPQTGLYQFEDVNGDGTINTLDKKTARFIGVDFYGGLQNSFQYKGFQLDVLFQFVKQTKTNYLSDFYLPGSVANEPQWISDRWMKAGEQATYQQYSILSSASEAYERLKESTESISDGSFIRLKNLSLSWTLPQNRTRKLRMENLRLFIQAQNLFTITNYKGLDPETGTSFLPPLRIISGGFHITF